VFRKNLDKEIKKSKQEEENFAICTKCREPLYALSTNDNKCPHCGGELENLNGFYDRHPELKEENKKETKEK
jgi:PHP family Zn ribbon phosphoesterase